jgi:dihydrofolate reductase
MVTEMRKIIAQEMVSVDGYFAGPNGELDWFVWDDVLRDLSISTLDSVDTLLFGRVTYEMMAGYWPTPMAIQNDPVVAAGMNRADKIVFSRTLEKAEWENTRLVKENIAEEIRKMKALPGKDMTLLGSGSIVTQFAQQGLIDEYQIMVDPVALGDGTPLLKGIRHKLDLELISARTFRSGVVLLCYRPLKQL